MDLLTFYFSLLALLIALAAAEVARGFANAVQARRRIPIGALTLILGLFVLLDLSSFWRWAWANRMFVGPKGLSIEATLLAALLYYFAARLVFPRPGEKRATRDAHYWIDKRFVAAALILANLVMLAFDTAHYGLPSASAPLAWLGLVTFYLPLVALLFTRGTIIDLVLLGIMIAHFIITNAYRISAGG
jgi:hypothetical protein